MKLSFRDIEPFVKKPNPAARVILVYGPDAGLMRERADIMGKTVVDDLNDPFNAVTLTAAQLAEDTARLYDEASAISMMGGDRLIRITDATDKLTTLLKDYLKDPSPSALVVVEAEELSTRSSLRKLCESAKNAAAVPCYVEDERDLARLIRDLLQKEGLSAQGDAVSYLAQAISGDRQKARREIEKLVIYKGTDKSPVSLTEAMECCGDAGATTLDELIYAVAGRQPEQALRSYQKLLGEDVNFVVILRSLQSHFRKLHLVRAQIDEGANIDSAIQSMQPPLFFKVKDAFRAQLLRWNIPTLNRILSRLAELEAECKQTNAPVETLCAQTILGISASRG